MAYHIGVWGILCLFGTYVYAQPSSTDPLISAIDTKMQVKPPSAEAQSLGSFSEIPVDLYTGTVNISIPIYTVTQNDIQVPISLSYHGGGIKVTDECGLVGLGWTLNVGGVISRTIRGFPDELSQNSAYGYDRLSSGQRSFINIVKQQELFGDPTEQLGNPTQEDLYLLQQMELYGTEYDEGHFDVSPDNYSFSVQGLFGAFVGASPDIVQSNRGCRIDGNAKGFTIQEANGHTYTFSDVEHKIYPYKVGYGIWLTDWEKAPEYQYLYPSAWWLSSIQSKAGDCISFRYMTAKQLYPQPDFYGYVQYETKDSRGSFHTRYYNIIPFQNTKDTTYHQLLTQIESADSRIVFHYTIPQDISISPRLDSISVLSKANLDALIMRYIFRYSSGYSRAALQSLTKQGRNGKRQTYSFAYYPHQEVRFNDDRRDHWGYFSSNSTGRFDNKTYLDIIPMGLRNTGSRNASSSTATNNMLRSIIYPSGLVTEFDWEPHSFSRWSKTGGHATKEEDYSISYRTITEIVQQRTLCGKKDNEILSAEVFVKDGQRIVVDLSKYFYHNDLRDYMDCNMNWRGQYASDQTALIIMYDGKEIYNVHIDSTASLHPIEIYASSYGAGTYSFRLMNPRTMLANHGEAERCSLYRDYFNEPQFDMGNIYISVVQTRTVANYDGSAYNVGGVRIRRIAYKENNKALLTKEYTYTDTLDRSSGVLSYPPRYASAYQHCFSTNVEDSDGDGAASLVSDCPYVLVFRSSGLPYVMNGGGHIEYQRVVETCVGSSLYAHKANVPINRTEYYYRTAADDDCSDLDETNYGTIIPTDMLQLTSQQYLRGHLVKKVEYTDEIRTTSYNYNIYEKSDCPVSTGAIFTVVDYQGYAFNFKYNGQSVNPYKNFGIVKYRVIPYNKQLVEQTTMGDKTNTFHSYTYATASYSSALNAHMPITHTTLDAAGDTITEHFTYLANTDKITTCITTKYGYIVSAYRYDYDSGYRVVACYDLPVSNENKLRMTASLSWRLTDSYAYNTAINRVVEHIDHIANITTAYLWSYHGSYPIAEIVNVAYADVVAALTDNKVQQLTTTFQPDMSSVNRLRMLFPAARVSTMTYLPLVGMSSHTDPQGYTQYFTYDDFGELSEVYEIINGNKQIIRHLDYNRVQ